MVGAALGWRTHGVGWAPAVQEHSRLACSWSSVANLATLTQQACPVQPGSRRLPGVLIHRSVPQPHPRPPSIPAAASRICADGGANRLHDQIPLLARGFSSDADARAAFMPDFIKGDLDSVRRDVLDYYAARGVPFVDLSSDQDTTDLTKCLTNLDERIRGCGGGKDGGGGGGSSEGGGGGGSGGVCEGSGVSEEEARRLRSEHVIVVLGEHCRTRGLLLRWRALQPPWCVAGALQRAAA